MNRLINKIFKGVLLTGVLMFTLTLTSVSVQASGDYVVSDISTSGEITTIGSYTTFSEAVTVMANYSNGIVTHSASLSPTKIIAMTRGVAVSYTFRSGTLSDDGYTTDVTMTITQYATDVTNQKTTYIPSHYDMQYLGTVSYDASTGNGRVHVVISGFDGYADLQQLDLVPMVYIENSLPITLGGNTFNPAYEDSFELLDPHQTQFTITDGELVFQTWSFYTNADREYRAVQRNNVAIGLKADWMTEGAVYYSYDFTNFYSDRACTVLVGTYYNYYQYLPLRSTTNITAAQFNSYLLTKKSTGVMIDAAQVFLDAQDEYGTNALLLYALACQESAYGTSSFATTRNNLFGINALDSDPSAAYTFDSVEDCVDDMAGWFLRRYMDIGDWRFFGTHLGDKESGFNVKYASDPYWGAQIAAIAYSIDKSAGLVDYEYYALGVINEYNVNVKADASDSSATLYTSAYGSTYQKDFTVILNQLVDGYYEVPTTNSITDGVMTSLGTTRESYNFLESLGYILESQIDVLSDSVYADIANPITLMVAPEYYSDGAVLDVSTFTFDADGLDISGYAFNQAVAARTLAAVSHTLVFKNTDTGVETTFTLNDGVLDSTIDTTYSVDNLSYSGATFTANNIDLSGLANGEYEVLIRVTYAEYIDEFDINVDLDEVPDVSEVTPALVFSETDNKLYLTINNTVEKDVAAAVDTFDWGTGENADLIHIRGIAALKGVDHNDVSLITHQLVIYNISDDTEYTFPLTTYSGDDLDTYNVDLYDGYSYYYSWYDGYIDLSELPAGNYLAKIEVTVESADGYTTYEGSLSLRNSLIGNIPAIKTLGDKVILINKNGRSVSRYEISVIDGLGSIYTAISKPTSRITYTEVNAMTMSEGQIDIQGIMYLYSIDQSAEQTPAYTLYLVKDGTVALQVDLSTTTGAYDITSIVNSGNDYTYAWYEGSAIDISGLANGTYDLLISETCDSYFEVINLYDKFSRYLIDDTYDGRDYSLTVDSTNYYHMTLTISETPADSGGSD